MQIKLRIIVFGITCLFLLSTFFAYADEDRNPLASSYLFFLYYDNGQIFANRDFEFKYDVIPETFVPETLNTQFPYKGEVINFNNQVVFTFQFDPRQGNPQFLKGTLSVRAPYVPDGQKVVFYDSQGQSLLTIFVSESSFCNDDGVCNPDVGEDTATCPNDCKIATPPPVGGPTAPTDPSADNGKGMIKIIVYLIIGVGVAGGFWWWRKRKSGLVTGLTSNLPPLNPNNPA